MSKTHLSPRDFGQAIGVSESSLKRWVDEGAIHAPRTAGGHRRIPLHEALRFVRRTGLRVVRPHALGLTPLSVGVQLANPSAQRSDFFHEAFVQGEADLAGAALLSSYLDGDSVADICDNLIAPAMHRIGQLWLQDRNGIGLEHRATATCLEALNHFRAVLPPPASDAPLALGCAPEHDPYIIPSLAAATVLAASGWQQINLGPFTPMDVLVHSAQTLRPRLVWIAFTSLVDAGVLRELHDFVPLLEDHDGSLIIGGQGLLGAATGGRPALNMGASMGDLERFAQGAQERVAHVK
jgi:methanogenic corrinoid protein MtbC1